MRGVKKIGVCAFACILTPSPFGHSPYIPCRNTGGEVEMYSSFAFAPILYRTPRHAAGYGRGRGGLPQSLPLTGIIYPLRPCGHLPYILCYKTQGRRLIPYDVSCLSFTPPLYFPTETPRNATGRGKGGGEFPLM